jgi:hypothetical protein
MIHRIATILKDRIAAFTYVDKIGGLTRVARQQREGKEIVIPVAGDVDEAYACDPATIRDMVPDDRYGCMVYFEDRGTTRESTRTRGTFYSASLRLVCWVNTAKFGSDPNAADRIIEQFVNDLNVGQPYNTDTLIGLNHQVDGFPQRGASIFSQYTYPEAARQYLLWPFDAFAVDITATYRIKPGCEDAPVPDDDACWTPPVTKKRRNPSEFTCDELTDPVTGLTTEQLGPECLDCDGGECDPLSVRVNGEPYATIEDPCGGIASVEVVQGDVPVGELIGGQWVVPECPPCDDLTISINAEDGVIIVPNPCGESVAIAVTQGGVEVGSWNGTEWVVPECPPCDDLSYTLVNTDDTELESGVVVDPCGASLNLVAPDADVTFDGLPVLSVPSGATGNLDCGSTIESAHVTLGGNAENGIYYISGTAGGKTRYEKNATHAFEYSGTRWVLIRPGSDHQAALGNETYPWLADWTGTGIAVDEGTISQYCGGNIEPCADLTIEINGTTYGTVADPCGATAPVDVHDSGGNDVGSLVSGAWVVAAPANVLREYTTGGSWSKPTDASFRGVWVFAAGGGGSGGAGNLLATNTALSGGAGGGGGSIVRRWIPAASLLTTETYAIGAGAAGVATGDGTAGGATLFGLHAEAKGGGGGVDGNTAGSVPGGVGGNALLNVPIASGTSISGGVGGIGRQVGATTGTAGMITTAGAGGGGGGGRTTTLVGNGNEGGGCYYNGSLTAGGAGGIANGGNGTAGANDIYLDPFLGLVTSTIGIGTSGGGGAGNTGASAVAGSGAAGGRAAGGGGGGSQSNGAGGTRGAGGAGGDGFIILYEVFAI